MPFDPSKPYEVVKGRTVGSTIKDTAIDIGKGVVGLGESAVGIADLFTRNAVGSGLAKLGYDPEGTKKTLSSFYSDQRKDANENVQSAEGFWQTVGSLIENPSVAFGAIVESAPMSITGVAAARTAATKLLGTALANNSIPAGTVAAKEFATKFFADPKVRSTLIKVGAGTEGAITSGQVQEQGRQAGRDYSDTALPSLAAGGLTTAIGYGTSFIPGLRDAEATVATAGLAARKPAGFSGSVKEVGKGMLKEGPIEEGTQSAQEQYMTNIALGEQDRMKGVGSAAGMGTVVGAAQGGAMVSTSELVNAIVEPAATEQLDPEKPSNLGTIERNLELRDIEEVQKQTVAESLARADAKIAAMDEQIKRPIDLSKIGLTERPYETPAYEPPIGPTQEDDLMYDFSDQAQSVQDQEDAKYRNSKFNKLKSKTESEKSLRKNSFGAPSSAEEAAKVMEQPTEKMREVEKRAARQEDLEAVFSERNSVFPPAIVGSIVKMENDLKTGDRNGVIVEGNGNNAQVTGGYPSTNPDWFKAVSVKQYDKENGTSFYGKITKDRIASALEKLRSGQKLNKIESLNWDYMQKAAEKESNTDPELVANKEYSDLEKQGFEFEAPKRVAVGNIDEGDQVVVIGKNGIPDKLTRKGRDENGDIVIKDGTTITADEFDQIEIIAQKKGEPNDPIQTPNNQKSIPIPTETETKINTQATEGDAPQGVVRDAEKANPSGIPADESYSSKKFLKEKADIEKMEADSKTFTAEKEAKVKKVDKAISKITELENSKTTSMVDWTNSWREFENAVADAEKIDDKVFSNLVNLDEFRKKKDATAQRISDKGGGLESPVEPTGKTVQPNTYDKAQENLAQVRPTIKADKNITSSPNTVLMNVRTSSRGEITKIAAPHNGTKEDALRVAKALKLYASEEYGASMQQSETFATNKDGEPEFAFVQGKGETEVVDVAKKTKYQKTEPQPQNGLPKGKEVVTKQKSPWQMPLDEYKESIGVTEKSDRQENIKANNLHNTSVKEAYKFGLPVPKENLKRWGLGEAETPQDRAMEKYFAKLKKEEQSTPDKEPAPKTEQVKPSSDVSASEDGSVAKKEKSDAIQSNKDKGAGRKTPVKKPDTVQPDNNINNSVEQEGKGEVAAEKDGSGEDKVVAANTEIEDFGEKIGGARKDYAVKLSDAKRFDIATVPLSKSFPEPKYEELLAKDVDPMIVGLVRALRDEIPNKPSSPYKVPRYVKAVEVTRELADTLLYGKVTSDQVVKLIKSNSILENVAGRAELYAEVGHSKSLKGISFGNHFFSYYKGEKNVSMWLVEKKQKATAFGNWPTELGKGKTKEEAIANFKEKYKDLSEKKTDKKIKFDLYQYKADPKTYWLGKKVGQTSIDLKSFATIPEAKAFLKENYDDLVAELQKRKYQPDIRRKRNEERIGEDYRNGEDVTPETFSEAFGFRGVEFGNWVKAKGERQNALNNAFDALSDLAKIMNVPTQAISLNGELGLAFGARGTGGLDPAAAHYEPVKIVINLTRKEGAGSLAHEWWHAVDNYFSRNRNQPDEFLSERPMQLTVKMRQEMVDAFKDLADSINKTEIGKRSKKLDETKSKPYWSTGREISARSFENYIIHKLKEQGFVNDYLANIVSKKDYTSSLAEAMADSFMDDRFNAEDYYPYLTDKEIKTVVDSFDRFFKEIKTQKTDKGIALYSKTKQTKNPADIQQELTQKLGRSQLDRLTRSGLVNIVSQDEADGILAEYPEYKKSEDELRDQAILTPEGKIYFISGNIRAGNTWGVFLHELSVHAKRLAISDKLYQQIEQSTQDRLDEQSATGEALRKADTRIPKNTKAYLRNSERLAYLIEDAPEVGIVRKLIARVKLLLSKTRYGKVIIDTFTVEDLKALAVRAVRRSGPAQSGELQKSVAYDERNPPSIGTIETPEEINRKMNRNLKLKAVRNAKSAVKKALLGIDKFLGASSTRLKNIHPKIEKKVRELDFKIGTRHTRDVQAVLPLMEKAKKMSAEDFTDFDFARKNSNTERINELVTKYGMEDEYKAYRETLDRIRDEANHVGLDIGWIKEYAPRVLKDAEGFLNHLGRGDKWPAITNALRARAKKMEISVADMSPELKAEIISNMLFGGGSGLGRPGNAKERTIKQIPPELNQYYMDSDGALMHYLQNIRKHVEIRNFFGKIPVVIQQAKSSMRQAEARLRKAQKEEEEKYILENPMHIKGDPIPESRRILGIKDTIRQYRDILDKYKNERDYSDNIGEYVMEQMNEHTLTPDQEQDLIDILRARFQEKGTRGGIQAFKNFSYITVMGSPISAITQIGDLAWTVYENGLIRSLKGVYGSVARTNRLTKEDVGIERIAQEFSGTDTLSNAVAKVFKYVGLEKMDTIGKESFLNAALEKFESRATKEPEKLKAELLPVYGSETDGLIEDLQNKEITDNVKLLVYAKLLDYQPAALSEMPEMYLKAGNGRLFYMLKSYTLKQFDVFRREVYTGLKSGNKVEKLKAMRNLVGLSAALILANGGADELKDFILGRKTSFEDRVVDNVLRLFGISKYVTWQARTEGMGTALAKQILPPFKFFDSLYKDFRTAGDDKGLETVSSVPVVGKIAYWHIGRGSYNRKDYAEIRFSDKKKRLNKIKEKVGDDRSLRNKYFRELAELKSLEKAQRSLTRMKKRINMAKKSGQSVRVERMEADRIKFIENYLKKSR